MTDGESVAKGWLGGRLLLRLQATLLGLLCFSVAAVPRLLPALLGLLAVLAAIHVFVTDPKRLLALLRTPIGLVLGIFIAYLFINAAWAIDPPASFAKAAGVLGLAVSVFLIAGSYSLCSVDDVRVLAKSALIGLVPGVAFLLIEVIFDEPITRFISNHIVLLFELNPKKVELEGGEVTKVSRIHSQPQRNESRPAACPLASVHLGAGEGSTKARRPRGADRCDGDLCSPIAERHLCCRFFCRCFGARSRHFVAQGHAGASRGSLDGRHLACRPPGRIAL